MSETHGENVVRNVIYDLVQRCASGGEEVSETLAAFMIKAVVLDPRNGFDMERTRSSQDIQRLTEICLQKLTETRSPFLDTVKMQVHFDLNYTTRREFVEEIHNVVESSLSSLSREITDTRVTSRNQVEALYSKITHYMLLRSGMGSNSDPDVLQQTTAALQSVFPQTELGSFMALLKREKEQQLKDLCLLVTGVLLFNRSSTTKDQDELNVQDLMPEVLREVLPQSRPTLDQELQDCEGRVWRFTSALEALTDPGAPTSQSPFSVELLRQALYNVRQHHAFVNILLADVVASVQRVELLQGELRTQLRVLRDTVKSRKAIAAAQVFPMFRSVSGLWSGLQDEAKLLHIFRSLTLRLRDFVKSQAEIFSDQSLEEHLQGSRIQSDAERRRLGDEKPIEPAEVRGPDTEWLVPEDPRVTASPRGVQLSGFCGHTLVCRDGLLLPGNPQLGLLKHKEKLYAFSTRDAALLFASDPDLYISELAERAKRSPELIQLLSLHQQFTCLSPHSQVQSGEQLLVRPATWSSSGCQTDTHPVESFIDPNYEWNEWEMRRKALKLTDLRTKLTHSTQTNSSYLRRECSTQTFPPKDAVGQTSVDGQSSIPRPLVFLSGLRGQRAASVVKVELTRAVDE